jgi:hypothetical protein
VAVVDLTQQGDKHIGVFAKIANPLWADFVGLEDADVHSRSPFARPGFIEPDLGPVVASARNGGVAL